MQNRQIIEPVRQVWQSHCSTLAEALDETIRELRNLLRLDDYHRHGHDEAHLKEVMGPFAAANLNLSSLSEVLGTAASARCLPEERLQRIHRLVDELERLKADCSAEKEDYPIAGIGEEEDVIHALAEEHLNKVAVIFRNLRVAQLEIRSKYHPATHDPVFANFSWRQLSPGELRLCPPFIVAAELGGNHGQVLRKIMSLLESRKPLKVTVLRTSLRREYSPSSDPGVPATMAVETIPLAMRGVFFLQTCVAAPDHAKHLFDALTAPRPSLISLLAQQEGEAADAFHARAERAMRAKAFPAVVYDPDRAKSFVSCFDLSANPEVTDGYTFADFAAQEPEFATEFSDPPKGTHPDNLVPVKEYLDLARHQRTGKLPVVHMAAPDGTSLPKVASPAVVTQTADHLHLWKTLLEISGVDNPYVKSTRASLEAAFTAEQKAMLETVQHEMQQAHSDREKLAIAAAVQTLVANLTGVDASQIDVHKLVQ